MLEGEEDTPGFPYIGRDADGVQLIYQLNDMPPDLYGREVMLYIPPDCTLRINHVEVTQGLIEGATEDTLQGTERTFTTDASADVNQALIAALPDAIKKIIQDDALHLYKYAESPIAPILNLTQTTDYFPNSLTFIRPLNPPVLYTMPQHRYLTLWVIGEREYRFGNVFLIFDTAGPTCQDVGIYSHEGGVDDQVLPVGAGDPGHEAIERTDGSLSVGFLVDRAAAYFGRNVLLYIPLDCTLELKLVSVVLSSEEIPRAQEFPFQTLT